MYDIERSSSVIYRSLLRKGVKVDIVRMEWNDFEKNAEFLKAIFPADSKLYYYAFFHHDPFFHPSRILSVVDEGEVMSTLWSLPRIFHNGDNTFHAVGIANVGTVEKARGRGLASYLMDEAVELAKKGGDDFAVLVTDIPAFYSRWDFHDLGKYYADIPARSSLRGITNRKAEATDILKASSGFYQKLDLTVPLRNPASMRALAERNRWSSHFTSGERLPEWIAVQEPSGTLLYVYRTEREDRIDVHEFFWEQETHKENVVNLLSSFGSMTGKTVRAFHHPRILSEVGLSPLKDKETIMFARFSACDPGHVHLPQPEFF